MDTPLFWEKIGDARGRVADPTDGRAVVGQARALLAARPREEVVATQQVSYGICCAIP
ncbi:hypothetical protein ACFLIM_05600 [Nonomuraea sp. M3C6]|uniref:Uncharacterized protein n=1 Tax=Nonomuraea marmarensis TaxID=3351344 RepID=A0ABW7A5Q2_9ACTN